MHLAKSKPSIQNQAIFEEEYDLQCFTYKSNLTTRIYCECLDDNDDFPVILPHSERPCCALSLY